MINTFQTKKEKVLMCAEKELGNNYNLVQGQRERFY